MNLQEANAKAQAHADRAAQNVREWSDSNHAIGGVCDFCCTPISEAPKGATYIAGDTQLATVEMLDTKTLGVGNLIIANDPYWYACGNCDPVVAEEDPAKLARYVIENRHDRAGVGHEHDAEVERDLTELYESLFKIGVRRDPDYEPPTA